MGAYPERPILSWEKMITLSTRTCTPRLEIEISLSIMEMGSMLLIMSMSNALANHASTKKLTIDVVGWNQ